MSARNSAACRRASPSEDCSGITGCCNLLNALANPRYPEHEELSKWIGGRSDPEVFTIDRVNRRVHRYTVTAKPLRVNPSRG